MDKASYLAPFSEPVAIENGSVLCNSFNSADNEGTHFEDWTII